MLIARLKSFLTRFRDSTRGTVTVETVIVVPLLFWTLSATYEFFEMYRYKSVREKASYTIVDMISREQTNVSTAYVDNTKTLFDDFTNDRGENQMRISIITYNSDDDEYAIVWSEVRGDGPLDELTDDSIKTRHDILPIMGNGEHLIQVEILFGIRTSTGYRLQQGDRHPDPRLHQPALCRTGQMPGLLTAACRDRA